MTSSSPIAANCVTQSIDRLRQLTQADAQPNWRFFEGDLPDGEAIALASWSGWQSVTLNDRQHIAWVKGKRVLWLGQRLVIPSELAGYPLEGLALRMGLLWWAELAQVFVNGKLVQEGDLFDCSTRVLLSAAARPGETIDIALRLVSPGHDDGALVRSTLLYEASDLRSSPEPGFVADELTVLQLYLEAFKPDRLSLLEASIERLNWTSVRDRIQFDQALAQLRQELLPFSEELKQRQISLLGHAHLDLAWLWPIPETWEAAERTFKSVLSLQEEFPNLLFGHSTPALYHWLEVNRPALFAAIQQQIAAGRWEVIAGLWVEPELNTVSGESIARQVLYGQRYTQERFGQTSPIAWLPDCFGFSWQLPQILTQGDIHYFVTQKLRWNDSTQFPHDLFWWRSPDGSQIISLHSAPIGEGIDPVKMARYAVDWERSTQLSEALWLPGVGDHGGGPTRDMLQVAQRWQSSPFFPTVQFSTAEDFLARSVDESGSKGRSLPVWNDELYLEFHRGCYTTHADQKQQNRRGERLLYQAELFSSIATLLTRAPYPKAELESTWKQVLFNQFHDILPGSSIPEVFEEANRIWQEALESGDRILETALNSLIQGLALPAPPQSNSVPVVVFNSLTWERSELVSVPLPEPDRPWQMYSLNGEKITSQLTWDGRSLLFQTNKVPAAGMQVFWLCSGDAATSSAAAPETWQLENEYLLAVVNSATGDLDRVYDKRQQREVLSSPGNQLQAFRDEGQYWDAWNIDPQYEQYPLPAPALEAIEWREAGPLRWVIRVVRRLGNSTFEQNYVLEQNSPVLRIETRVDWQERHIVVKAAFPLTVTSDRATYEIPFGAIERSTNPETPQDKAKWEVPALQWADLGEDHYGVSLLNDCKYGYDSRSSQLRLTLLRGSTWPNPAADLGFHQFTYALYPHDRTWQEARTVQRGYELNQPLIVRLGRAADQEQSGTIPPNAALLPVPAENLILSAFKQSEDDSQQWVLRLYECCGRSAAIAFTNQTPLLARLAQPLPTNLLETPSDPAEETTFAIAPWKIATFQFLSRSADETAYPERLGATGA